MSKRVAVYARYSSDLQKATSIEDQIAMAERFCTQKGWTIVQVFSDREMSGKDTRRPGFQQMKAAANRQAFDVVVVEAIDRLTRKVKDALSTYDLFSFQNIELHSIQEGPQDFLKVLFAGFGAQMFSQKIADHTRRGMQGAVTRHRLHTRAYGYRKLEVETGLNREIDPDQAEVLRRIYREFAGGKSSLAIAAGLNADRVPAPNGGTWAASTLRGNPAREEGILRNRLYIGIASVCKNTHTHHPETGQRKIKPTPQDAVETEIPELRIIPQDLWEAVQAELARRAAATPKAARAAQRSHYLLSGLLTCGCCGAPYIIASRTGYRCRESRKQACNNTVSISRKRIEARVFAGLRQVFTAPEMIARFDKALEAERANAAGGALEADLTRLTTALAKAEAGQANIIAAIAEGAPFAVFKVKSAELEAEIADLQGRIRQTEARIAQQALPLEDAATVYARALEQMDELLGDPDLVEEANGYLGMLIRSVTLTPDEAAPHGIAAQIVLNPSSWMPGQAGADPDAPDDGARIPC